MSAPFGFHIHLISGQEHAREIVVASASLLSMHYLAIHPIAGNGPLRENFLMALAAFAYRERMFFHERADKHIDRLSDPNDRPATKVFFWLALDAEGESLARKIMQAQDEVPDRQVHRTVKKLNLVESPILPPPEADVPSSYWEDVRMKYSLLMADHRSMKSKESFRSFCDRQFSPTPEQAQYFAWFESLYESLSPWQDMIKTIQSDLS